MSCNDYDRLKILFSWNNGDLILQVRRPEDSQILQLIPRSTLLGDLPRHFVDEYIHWLHVSTLELEFRPVGSPWASGPSNWRLIIPRPGVHSRPTLQKPNQDSPPVQLIDVRSSTFAAMSGLLSPLESSEHIIATRSAQKLEVSLPRLHLSFFLNTNMELECRSMPGYVIDTTQSCGTMFGLRNKLILRPSSTMSEQLLLPRRVIIPQGEVSFAKQGDFADVFINTDAQKHVRWHEYTIDNDIGCLRSNASLSSKLYQCYLHALTSHCLADPLLGHTGTEEALYILRSAACRSFQRLDLHEAKLLELISNLTPERIYYPPHLKSMATVKWNDLPALSQHHDFFRTVCSILDHARSLEVLYDQPGIFGTPDRNELLLNRAAFRNKLYYPSDLQISERSSSLDDVKYRARDVSDSGTAEQTAYQISWSIWNARPFFDRASPNLWDIMDSWGSLGPAASGISLRYSRHWLEFDAARDWFAIYDLCRNPVNGNPRIELTFSLSAASYSKSVYTSIIPFVIVFALDERCRNLSSPPDSTYTLSDGLAPGITQLEDLVSKSARPTNLTPAHSKKAKRRKAEYDLVIRRESPIVAKSIFDQWPDYESVNFRGQWLDKVNCKRRVEEYFQSISWNIRLREHVLQLQNILQRYLKNLTPAASPYLFYPQFITRNSKAPSYAIHDILISRPDVPAPSADGEPFSGLTTSTATTIEDGPLLAGSDGLEILIEELRHSPQPLVQLFGNELDESHRELLRENASISPRVAVPSLGILRRYHDGCSHKKDNSFSEILAALAPSQDVEKTSGVAGLWPRITPRSLLHQLAHDRISMVPDQWKSMITRYAISLLKYQQSLRLLELSSRQRHEELLREIEAIRNGVQAELIPDWLLIQVRPSPFWRSN